jgi:aspartyl protease family protein
VGVWIALGLLCAAAVALIVSHDAGSVAGFSNEAFARLVAGLALVIFLGSALLGAYRGRIGNAARDIAAWLLLMLLLVGVYAYRAELLVVAERVAGELLPRGSQMSVNTVGEAQAVRVRRGWDGHFTARVSVGSADVEMVVDTGASALVLTARDARRAGLDLSDIQYNVPVETANGRAYAARITLDRVALGPLRRRNVEALITQPGTLSKSLLGMSFLSRLRSYEFSGDVLTLRG